jgi:hypothetical protein
MAWACERVPGASEKRRDFTGQHSLASTKVKARLVFIFLNNAQVSGCMTNAAIILAHA